MVARSSEEPLVTAVGEQPAELASCAPCAARVPSEVGPLLRLSIPIVVTQLGQMLLGTVDTMIAGRISMRALDAVALGALWQYGTMVPMMGIVLGLDPLVSQGHGGGRGADVSLALQRALLIALGLSVLVIVAWSYAEPALLWLGQDQDLAHTAAAYVSVQRFSAPGFLLYGALSTYLMSRGIVRPGIVAMVLANLFNAGAAWALSFGSFGLPALGVRGLGLATALTRILLPLAMTWLIVQFRLHEGAWFPWSRRVLDRGALRKQLALGLPMGIALALELWAFNFGTVIAGQLDHVALAAHAIALNLSALAFMVPMGLGIGTSARVGQLIGAGQPAQADRAARTALRVTASYALCSALMFALASKVLPTFYSRDAAVVLAAAQVLPIAGAFQLFDGLQSAGAGVLRGMGKPRVTTVINLVGYFAIAMPFAWYSALHTPLGLPGVWLGYALGLAFVATCLVVQVLWRGPRYSRPL